MGQCRLRDVEGFSGPGQTTLGVDGADGPEVAEFEVHLGLHVRVEFVSDFDDNYEKYEIVSTIL